MDKIPSFTSFLGEEEKSKSVTGTTPLSAFAETRAKGAAKIAETAEEKGGLAMLTYNHFFVKAKYYQSVLDGGFDKAKAVAEFTNILASISLDMDENQFQQEVGKMEVLGELLIYEKTLKNEIRKDI